MRVGSFCAAAGATPHDCPRTSGHRLYRGRHGLADGFGHETYTRWRSDMCALGRCENACASISATECIFEMNWTEDQAELWIRSTIEAFGPKRSMFGSHLPIDTLSYGFDRLYDAYERIVGGASDDEKDALFRTTGSSRYRGPMRPTPARQEGYSAASLNLAAAASGVRSLCGEPSISKPTMNFRIVAERKSGG